MCTTFPSLLLENWLEHLFRCFCLRKNFVQRHVFAYFIRFSVIKIRMPTKFNRLYKKKVRSEIFEKLGMVNDVTLIQASPFSLFFPLEKSLFIKKNEKHYWFFYYKNRNTYKFHAFTFKNDF